ncbi:MaoC family dehydratase [Arsenicitalea aurantiaca]|uniref:MaoC family dehydratase n=1 Tax=Arsenicitalea aurantiaca TaxID=1783274 RepID=A0A433XLK6_9HYPH|nr:MaoC family dehydratase [Arsenicitalea aurantiaca]RUT34960.1 MaoC family dehydratase [Arsenicitalea aurantiaca]
MNPVTAGRRHFEDLAEGEVITLGETAVSREMIIAFAREFDPLPFHLDEKAAKASLLGGLAASGWQTGALTLRMLVDTFLGQIAAMGGLGFTDLKWRRPVMVGDTIGGTATITGLRRSASHPDWGIMTLAIAVSNQKGEPVMTMTLSSMVATRPSGDGEPRPTPQQPYDLPSGHMGAPR